MADPKGPKAKTESRIVRLEAGQQETNRQLARVNVRLGKIDTTLQTASKVFELMHDRLERLERGQDQLIEGQQALVDGQRSVVARLDRLIEATIRLERD